MYLMRFDWLDRNIENLINCFMIRTMINYWRILLFIHLSFWLLYLNKNKIYLFEVLEYLLKLNERILFQNWNLKVTNDHHSTLLRLSWASTRFGTSSVVLSPLPKTNSWRSLCCLGPSCWMMSGNKSLIVLVSDSPETMNVLFWIEA
jgi:hypothetical protein